MKPLLPLTIITLCITLHCATTAHALRACSGHRHRNSNADTVRAANGAPKGIDKSLGKFNYTYLRLATFFPSPGFGNPLESGFAGSEGFGLRDDLPNRYRLAYESGKARHFMSLNLGSPMLKLAINSGIAIEAFGKGNKTQGNGAASTDGFYLMKLALGPQVTFKPIRELRVGLFYRAGIALLYTNYQNMQRTAIGPDRTRLDKVDVTYSNYAYHGDLGLDISYRAMSIGVGMQMLKLKTSKGALFSRDGETDEHNAVTTSIEQSGVQEGAKFITPIDPMVSFNRICVSLGFAL